MTTNECIALHSANICATIWFASDREFGPFGGTLWLVWALLIWIASGKKS